MLIPTCFYEGESCWRSSPQCCCCCVHLSLLPLLVGEGQTCLMSRRCHRGNHPAEKTSRRVSLSMESMAPEKQSYNAIGNNSSNDLSPACSNWTFYKILDRGRRHLLLLYRINREEISPEINSDVFWHFTTHSHYGILDWKDMTDLHERRHSGSALFNWKSWHTFIKGDMVGPRGFCRALSPPPSKLRFTTRWDDMLDQMRCGENQKTKKSDHVLPSQHDSWITVPRLLAPGLGARRGWLGARCGSSGLCGYFRYTLALT